MKGYNKKFFFAAFMVMMMLCVCSRSKDSDSVAAQGVTATLWTDFNEGYSRALKEKKPMVVDFYADWCHWCKVMDNETFSDSEVAGMLAKDFVTIRIHTDRPGAEKIKFGNHSFPVQDFSAMLGVQGLPTVVFFDMEGKPITKIPGFIKKETFLPLLKYISEGCYLQNVPFESYLEGRASCGGRKQQIKQKIP